MRDRKLETTDLILDAAEGLFSHHSFNGLRMGQISDHLGMSRKTLYNHFPGGKREIWQCCIQRRLDGFAGRLFALTGDTRRDFVERGRDILGIGREAMATFYGPAGLIPTTEDERLFFPDLKKKYVEALTAFFEEGTRLGYLRPGLPLRSLAAALIVLISYWHSPEGLLAGGECESLPEFVETVMFDGILSEEGRQNAHRLYEETEK